MTTKRNMCKLKGMSEAKVEKIKEAAAKIQVDTSSSITFYDGSLHFSGLWIYYRHGIGSETPDGV
jgi:hypothetical protein